MYMAFRSWYYLKLGKRGVPFTRLGGQMDQMQLMCCAKYLPFGRVLFCETAFKRYWKTEQIQQTDAKFTRIVKEGSLTWKFDCETSSIISTYGMHIIILPYLNLYFEGEDKQNHEYSGLVSFPTLRNHSMCLSVICICTSIIVNINMLKLRVTTSQLRWKPPEIGDGDEGFLIHQRKSLSVRLHLSNCASPIPNFIY